MNNSYVLPLCFAAAAHGALLFGFTRNPVSMVRLPEKKSDLVPFVVRERDEEPPVVVDADAAPARSKAPIETLQPLRSPEPEIVITTNQPTMRPPPFQPVGSADVRQLLEPNIGVVGGAEDGPWRDGIISPGLLDNPPRTRFQAAPMYPFQAKREGASGEVMVDFVVNEQGRVMDPRVVKSSHAMFEEPTLRAVSKWQFEPGKRDGKVVKFRMTVPVIFNLNDFVRTTGQAAKKS